MNRKEIIANIKEVKNEAINYDTIISNMQALIKNKIIDKTATKMKRK